MHHPHGYSIIGHVDNLGFALLRESKHYRWLDRLSLALIYQEIIRKPDYIAPIHTNLKLAEHTRLMRRCLAGTTCNDDATHQLTAGSGSFGWRKMVLNGFVLPEDVALP